MAPVATAKKSGGRKGWWFGLTVGIVLMAIIVLASGFMIETTNTDTFCVSCHVMIPFRTAWQGAFHGGQNPQGFAAQCVDCHLPHGNFYQYFITKAVTGIGDVIHNLYIDPYSYDWIGKADEHRQRFTFDSACRHCHHVLTPPGMPRGGFLAHRAYLRGDTQKHCSECHPHVGHHNLPDKVRAYFKKPPAKKT